MIGLGRPASTSNSYWCGSWRSSSGPGPLLSKRQSGGWASGKSGGQGMGAVVDQSFQMAPQGFCHFFHCLQLFAFEDFGFPPIETPLGFCFSAAFRDPCKSFSGRSKSRRSRRCAGRCSQILGAVSAPWSAPVVPWPNRVSKPRCMAGHYNVKSGAVTRMGGRKLI